MAVQAAKLGASASFLGRIGSDPEGALLRRQALRKGLDSRFLKQLCGCTAVSEVSLQGKERIFGAYHEGVLADWQLTSEELAFLKTQDIVVTDLWGHQEASLRELRPFVRTAFDAADRPQSGIAQKALPHCDFFFFSAGSGDLQEELRAYQQVSQGIVTATLGAKGSLAYDGRHFHSQGALFCEEVRDTMGAGDAFIASFLLRYLQEGEIGSALAFAAGEVLPILSHYGAQEENA